MSEFPLMVDDAAGNIPRLSLNISNRYLVNPPCPAHCEIGVLKGEGIGPEVIDATLTVLSAIQSVSNVTFEIHFGGCIGVESAKITGNPLSDQVISFCETIFARGGAVLSGPGGGRYVYDLRKHFDLFCKLNPLSVHKELRNVGRLKPEYTDGVDMIVVRENVAGIYQGEWTVHTSPAGTKSASHRFSYSWDEVARIVEVAMKISTQRRGQLAVVVKANGIPGISDLWLNCARNLAKNYDVNLAELDIDHAAYSMIQHAKELDVVVTPNLVGDILSDLGGVLLGSRGLCYGGSFSASGCAVYQTNHGAAYDLAGTDRANPVAQILSLAMMLRESFGLTKEPGLIELAVRKLWTEGFRTKDIREPQCRIIGTRETGERVAGIVLKLGDGQN